MTTPRKENFLRKKELIMKLKSTVVFLISMLNTIRKFLGLFNSMRLIELKENLSIKALLPSTKAETEIFKPNWTSTSMIWLMPEIPTST